MLSIGKLPVGGGAASYYLERVGCPLDYYVGRGEAPGVWIGSGSMALGLRGWLDSAEQEEILRRLLAGRSPDDQELAKPVLRGDPRGRVPAEPVLRALAAAADARDVDVPALLTAPATMSGEVTMRAASGESSLVQAWHRAAAELARARRRPRWPTPTLNVDTAQRLLQAAGLDPTDALAEATPSGRVRDVLARALRHREDRVDVRLPGLDLTLSAPKSVSLLWALSDGEIEPNLSVGEQVRAAHRVAVSECLAYLELHCTAVLRGHHRGDGTDRYVGSDGLIGAAFEHRSSRCGDPQLHTHVVVANLLHGEDGEWSALNSREIYAHARTAGFVYQAVLRGELTRRLGVSWQPVRNGQAEIAGVPPGLLRLFSKRRQQIEAHLEQLGLDTPAAAQNAALGTRPAKPNEVVDLDQVGLQDRWRGEATAAGFRLAELNAVLQQPDGADLLGAARETAAGLGPIATDLAETLLSPSGLTEKRATFDRRELFRGVCEHLPAGLPIRLVGLRALATRVLRDERVVPLLGDAPVSARRYSTRELLTLEQDALDLATAQQPSPAAVTSDAKPFVPVAVLPNSLVERARERAEESGCSPEQQAMVHRLLNSGSGVDIVVGAAGSGKTRALAVVAQAWQRAGVDVQGTALAAIAARVLEDSASIPSCSLQRVLNRLNSSDALHGPNGFPHPGGVLVVDEAGMVGTRALHRLIEEAQQRHVKLVLVGDPKQLPEIDAGGLFATLAARLPATVLLDNQRQRERWEHRALRELRDGDVVRALTAYRKAGRLRIDDSVSGLTRMLLEDYERHLGTHPAEQILVVASSRGDARRLNAQLRQRLLADGHLGEQELRIQLTTSDGSPRGERGYRVGEQVLVTVNDYPRGLLNGTRGTVTALHGDRQALTVRLDDGRSVDLDRDYLGRGQVSYGYALTAHKAQGTTVDIALLWGTQALTRETGYVALSRGREANYLYSTWDLLRRDAGFADHADLDLPGDHRLARPDATARVRLVRAALAERLERSGRQRTARSWWRGPVQDRVAVR
jgi:conjugative relaxase-like TrwC/TraI family protein